MIERITDAWLGLLGSGAIGAGLAVLLLVVAVLLAGNAVVWTLAGIKWAGKTVVSGYRHGTDS